MASGNEGKGQRMPEPEAPPPLSCCSHTIGHLCPVLMPWGGTNFIWFPLLTAEGIPHPRYWKTEIQGRGPCSWEPGAGSPRHSSTIHEAGLGSKVVSESKVCSGWRGGVGSDDRGCPTPPSASFRSSCWKLRVSSGLLDAVAGNQVAAIASPVWTHPGTPLGPKGWTGQAWQGWSRAAAAGTLRSGGSPRRNKSSPHPAPL